MCIHVHTLYVYVCICVHVYAYMYMYMYVHICMYKTYMFMYFVSPDPNLTFKDESHFPKKTFNLPLLLLEEINHPTFYLKILLHGLSTLFVTKTH